MFVADKSTLIASDKNHVWHHLTQHKAFESNNPLMIVKGEGMTLTDIEGKKYLDATSGGVWTVNVGYGRKEIVDVIAEQLLEMPYYAGTAGTLPAARFAKNLTNLTPNLNRVYFSNSGSEANEKAYKIVRQRAQFINGGKKHKIIFRARDYHGTTITALSSTGQAERKNQYGPFTPGFVEMPHCCCYRCPFSKKYGECNIECARVLEDIIQKEGPDTVGGVVLEPITAGGGVIVPVPEYYPIIQEICRKYDVLIHIDEVVCGLGRTGEWFGYQNFTLEPDIITSAKGLASGYAAISITMTTEDLFAQFKQNSDNRMDYFRDISTFGGCTAGPAAGARVLEVIQQENLLTNVQKVGEYLKDKLLALQEKYALIGEVRTKGFIAGLELIQDRETKEPVDEAVAMQIASKCLQKGVMIGRTNRSFAKLNNVLILSPAFICTTTQIDQIIETLDQALGETA